MEHPPWLQISSLLAEAPSIHLDFLPHKELALCLGSPPYVLYSGLYIVDSLPFPDERCKLQEALTVICA